MTKDKPSILDDTFSDYRTSVSQCMSCKNERAGGTCTAYPDGIPKDIWTAKRKDCKFYKSMG